MEEKATSFNRRGRKTFVFRILTVGQYILALGDPRTVESNQLEMLIPTGRARFIFAMNLSRRELRHVKGGLRLEAKVNSR